MVTKHGSVYEDDSKEVEPEEPPTIGDRVRAHWLAWVTAFFSTVFLIVVVISPQLQQGGFYEGLFAIVAILSVLRALEII